MEIAMSLSPETEEVLRRARLSTPMAPEQRRRLKARIAARIAATGAMLVAGDAAARGGVAAWVGSMSAAAKGVTAVALVASLGAGGYVAKRAIERAHPPVVQAARHDPEPAPRPAAPAVTERVEVPAPVIDAPSAVPEAAPKSSPRPSLHTSAPTPVPAPAPTGSLVDEAKLLTEADQALRAGNPARANALLDEHAARFPSGQLAGERAAERMVVQCQTGAVGAAAGERFLAEHPGNPLGARIRQACRNGQP
jgi:hypothetical protein